MKLAEGLPIPSAIFQKDRKDAKVYQIPYGKYSGH
jgi:hypothetical protein